jgi:DUF1680 family protein
VKLYCTPVDSFWCGTGSGMENHSKYGDSIYFHDAAAAYVNLFIASELDWHAKQLRIVQTTDFPNEDITRLTIRAAAPTRMTLKIRHPSWCRRLTLTVNGRERRDSGNAGTYVDVDRVWRDGDIVEAHLPMQLHLEPLPGVPDIAAVMYGPIVLAGRFGTEGLTPGADIIVNERMSGEMLNIPMSIPELSLARVTRNSASRLSFTVRASHPDRNVELVPYHTIAHERYTLYWKLVA